MVGDQPAEQLARPARPRSWRPVDRRRAALQQLDRLLGPGDHLRPVLDGLLDQSQHLEQSLLESRDQLRRRRRSGRSAAGSPGASRTRACTVGSRLGLGGPVHDAVQGAAEIAPDQELGVEDLADAPALAQHLHGDRVDQERPVVGDDLDDGRAAGSPSVVGLRSGVRIVDHGPGGGPLHGGPVVALHQAEQVVDAAFVDVEWRRRGGSSAGRRSATASRSSPSSAARLAPRAAIWAIFSVFSCSSSTSKVVTSLSDRLQPDFPVRLVPTLILPGPVRDDPLTSCGLWISPPTSISPPSPTPSSP